MAKERFILKARMGFVQGTFKKKEENSFDLDPML